MSPGAWALRHADTQQLGDEGADVASPTKAWASTLSDPVSPRLVTSPTKALACTLPNPVSPRLVASPMKALSLTLPESAPTSVPEDDVPPAQLSVQSPQTPTHRSPSQSELETAGTVPSSQDWCLLDEEHPDGRAVAPVPGDRAVVPVRTSKPGKGKGGQCAEGKGKGSGDDVAEPPAGRPLNMTWAQGPDEGPMLAVEMSFDEEEYEMTFEAPEPPQELPSITEGAISKRMWRMFRPRQDGSYLVPESMVKEYQNKVTRPTVVRAFERCGYHVEKFLKKVNKTLEDVEVVEIEEDWEFMTEDEMREANWP
ncbi:unnamed protein product, partial [Symbiodinium sp. CCMP2592]